MKSSIAFGLVALTLFALELLTVLGSWVVVAAWPELPYRSLISFEGLRWLLGSFTESMSTPLLVWLIVWAIALGAASESGLWKAAVSSCKAHALSYRERIGLTIVFAELLLAIVIGLLLTCLPHALLLNAMGHLYPSAFSASIIPFSAFLVVICSLTYGSASGQMTSFETAYGILTCGIRRFAPVFPLYILLMQLVAAINFVL